MKKIHVLALGAIISLGSYLTSCNGISTSNPSLVSANDSLSYAFGEDLYNQGIGNFLLRSGLIKDTMAIRGSFSTAIANESDPTKKAALEKVMKVQIDSINKINSKALAELARGLKEGLTAPEAQQAYITGISMGNQIATQMVGGFEKQLGDSTKLDKDLVLSAIVNGLTGKKSRTENPSAIVQQRMNASQVKQEAARAKEMAAQEEKLKAENAGAIEAGKKFLEENKTKAGVVTLPSGLEYKIIKTGTGPKPTAESFVEVHYHGTLIDGTVFDSSVERNKTAKFGVNQVIPGWTEILQLMPVGSKWIVYVPYELGYGAHGAGDKIPPFSTLIFEIELLAIEH